MSLRTQASTPELSGTVRFFLERKPGNTLVPLVPVDQLPFQIQGIPRELSQRQVFEEDWKFVTEVSEAAVVLPTLPFRESATTITSRPTYRTSTPPYQLNRANASIIPQNISPVAPRYRAPDHAVLDAAADQVTDNENKPEPYTASTNPLTCIERRHIKKIQNNQHKLEPLAVYNQPSHTIQQDHTVADASHDSQLDPVARYSQITPTVDQKPMGTPGAIDNHISRVEASFTRVSPGMSRDIITRVSENGTTPGQQTGHIRTTSQWSSKIDRNHAGNWSSSGPRTPKIPEKIYCTHWITYGECSFGFRCKYKHEMPSLEVLKKETGFKRIPDWYKEKMAIQNRGPTWMESRLMKENANSIDLGDETAVHSPREFPDPSKLKTLRRENIIGSDEAEAPSPRKTPDTSTPKITQQKSIQSTKEDLPTKKVTEEPPRTPLLVDVESSTQPATTTGPANTASATAPSPTRAPSPVPATKPAPKKKNSPAFLRRHSQISWSSDTSGSTQPSKSELKNKRDSKKGKKTPVPQSQPQSQPKKTGLAASKHAPPDIRPVRYFKSATTSANDEDLLLDDADRSIPVTTSLI